MRAQLLAAAPKLFRPSVALKSLPRAVPTTHPCLFLTAATKLQPKFPAFVPEAAMSSDTSASGDEESRFMFLAKEIVPKLSQSLHKGQMGRIGVIGGSLEYTGAPYFAAISSLKTGADLVHVICPKTAATVIKSYSPELIVHPVLDAGLDKITPWLDKLHVVVVGPGLGRESSTFSTIRSVIRYCKEKTKPLIIDADGLYLIAQEPSLIKDYPGLILTPNKAEFSRLVGSDSQSRLKQEVLNLGCMFTVIVKGEVDEIFTSNKRIKCSAVGSSRRCGGQGDLLAGALATFYAWVQRMKDEDISQISGMIAGYAACRLTRECNLRAYRKKGRSMVCTDMIEEIHEAFEALFEK